MNLIEFIDLPNREKRNIVTKGVLKVTDNVVVSLDYVLRSKDKHELSRSSGDNPLDYLHGFNNIIPGLESELIGLEVGDEKDVIVPPKLGYGDRDPEGVVEFSRDTFPDSLNMEIGEPVMMRDNDNGESLRAYIVELSEETVMLDFNHPLAGKTLYFHVRIANLRDATSEELTHGHVHDGSHDH
jgi:FKBP-type peptidyl-prolyl cis-trans isomerase SlyD